MSVSVRCAVLSSWAGDGLSPRTVYRPAFAAAYPAATWEDAAGTPAANLPPSPNLTVLLCAVPDAAALLADPQWGPAVLWCEGTEQDPAGVPSDAGYAATCQSFAQALGVTVDWIYLQLGSAPAGRTRRIISEQVAAWLAGAPKG